MDDITHTADSISRSWICFTDRQKSSDQKEVESAHQECCTDLTTFCLCNEPTNGSETTSRHASMEKLWVRIPLSPPAGSSCHRCAQTCLEIDINLVPYMAALPLRHVISQWQSRETASHDFNIALKGYLQDSGW